MHESLNASKITTSALKGTCGTRKQTGYNQHNVTTTITAGESDQMRSAVSSTCISWWKVRTAEILLRACRSFQSQWEHWSDFPSGSTVSSAAFCTFYRLKSPGFTSHLYEETACSSAAAWRTPLLLPHLRSATFSLMLGTCCGTDVVKLGSCIQATFYSAKGTRTEASVLPGHLCRWHDAAVPSFTQHIEVGNT